MYTFASRLSLVMVLLTFFTLVKEVSVFRIYLLDFALLPLVFFATLGKLVAPERFEIEWRKIDFAMLLILLFVAIAVGMSYDRAQSVVELMDWLRIGIAYLAGRLLFSARNDEDALLRGLKVAAAILIGIGLIQLITGTAFGLIGNYFGGNLDQSITANVEGFDSKSRVSGTTTNPIIFAMWITLFSMMLLASSLEKLKFLAFFVISAVSSIVVVSTLSRGAIAAYGMSWLLVAIVQRQKILNVRMFIAISVAMLFSPIAVYVFIDKLELNETIGVLQARVEQQDLLEKDSARAILLETGMEMLKQPKIFVIGVGPGNFSRAASSRSAAFRSKTLGGARYSRSGIHNVWLKTWVEYGLGTFLLLVTFFVGALIAAMRVLTNAETETERIFGCGIVAFLIPYILIDSQVYESAMSYHLFIPLFLLIGVVVSKSRAGIKTKEAMSRDTISMEGLLR